MYIFKLDRYLLESQIKKHGSYMRGKILDLGAGNFNRYGSYFCGEECIKMDIENSDNVDVVGNATNIPFQDKTFDSIVSTQVFEHIAEPEAAAREVSRILKNGGHLLITVPQTNELHSEPYDYWRYTSFGVTELFKRHGLELVTMQQIGGFFSTIAHMWMRYFIDRWHLHKHQLLGRIFSVSFYIIGRIAIGIDYLDKSEANRKHALGWCAVFRKSSKVNSKI